MYSIPPFDSALTFLLGTLAIFAVVTGRYLLMAGGFYIYFYIWRKKQWQKRKLGAKNYSRQQFRRELGYSMATAGIFAVTGALMVLAWQRGYTKIYLDPAEYGYWYLPVSLVLYLLIHETYYYWLHRWMHKPAIFSVVHKVHHLSTITSPWTAFSFHPVEGLLQAVILPAMLFLIPIHPYTLLIQLTLMTITSVINHLDLEIYPANSNKHWFGKWWIGATHHSLHHKQFKYNYGLYFTLWDKLKKTESPVYEELFEEKTRKATV